MRIPTIVLALFVSTAAQADQCRNVLRELQRHFADARAELDKPKKPEEDDLCDDYAVVYRQYEQEITLVNKVFAACPRSITSQIECDAACLAEKRRTLKRHMDALCK